MAAYYIMLGIPAVLSVIFSFCKIKNIDKNKIIIDSFFFIWLLLLAFRSSQLGIDLPVYEYHFRNYSLLSWTEIIHGIIKGEFEASYVLISKAVSMFSSDFHLVMIVCALISVIPIWIMYHRETKHGYLMVVLFINIAPFAMYFSGLRQAIAMACVVPCYYYCRDKQLKKFLLVVLCAILLHNSAFILLFMYPVYHLRINKQMYIWGLSIIIGCIFIFDKEIFQFLLIFLGDKYITEYAGGIRSTGAYSVILLLVVLLIYSFFIVDSNKMDDDTIGLRNFLIICVIIQIFSRVHTLAMRMNYYYLLFVPLLIPRVIDRSKKKYMPLVQISLICMICFFSFYFFYRIYSGNDELGIYPYLTLFEDY